MSTKSLKEEAIELMKIKGNTTGSEFLTLKRYIQAKYGEEGVKNLEKKMAEIGYPLEFDKISPARWYKESLNVLTILVAKEIFGWKDLFDFGFNSPAFSFGVKIFIKYLPIHLFLRQLPKTWRKFFDVGTLEAYRFNEREKYILLRLKGYKFHTEMCRYFAGFFLRMAGYFIKGKDFQIEETKCLHKGDSYHEYKISWK